MPADRFDPFSIYDPSILVASEPIEIKAPAKVVWDVLVDLSRYGEWNPFCVWTQSTLEMGAPIHQRLVSYTNPGTLLANCEYICAFEPERLLSWEMHDSVAWPYPARRDQIISPLAPDKCVYLTTDAFTGPNGIHVMRFCGEWITRAFNDSARALKSRAEAIYRGEIQ